MRQAIIRAATEQGIDPSAALAIAERESNFDPRARSSKTIRGMFQMRGDLRRQYGVGDSSDPYDQAKGWGAFFRDNKAEMSRVLGRDPTDAEGYLGHHFGGGRAARMMKMDPATPVDSVFTREERRLNPHFDKAGTVGKLNSSVLADIGQRQAKFGGAPADYSEAGAPTEIPQPAAMRGAKRITAPLGDSAPDFSEFGAPVENSGGLGISPQQNQGLASAKPDFSQFGVAA